MLIEIMAGVSPRVVESALPKQQVEAIQHKLIVTASWRVGSKRRRAGICYDRFDKGPTMSLAICPTL